MKPFDLKNNHNVYILGAGFSSEFGLPLVKDFLNRMRDAYHWLIREGRDDEAKSISKVLKFRLEAASAAYRVDLDLENIEDLFSLASALDTNLTKDINVAIASTLDYSRKMGTDKKYEVMFDPEKFPPPPSWGHQEVTGYNFGGPARIAEVSALDIYTSYLTSNFCDPKEESDDSIISFNYDTLIEESIKRLGIRFNYGLEKGTFSTQGSITDDLVSSNSVLKLLKLHGSINWAFNQDKGLDIYNSYSEVLSEGKIPQLIPPTWRKVFTNHISDIWVEGVKALSKATRIIIIGFSAPKNDNHFKYLLAAGLQNNVSLRSIHIVNPNPRSLKNRLVEILGDQQIKRLDTTFNTDQRNRKRNTDSFFRSSADMGRINRKAFKGIHRITLKDP